MIPYMVDSSKNDPVVYGEWEVAVWTDCGDGRDMFGASSFNGYPNKQIIVDGVQCPVLAW